MNALELGLEEVESFWRKECAQSEHVKQIDEVFRRGWLEGPEEKKVHFKPGGVHPETGWLLYYLVRHLRPKLTVETGFGMGLSAMCQVAAHTRNAFGRHISIDPSFREWTYEAGLRMLEAQGDERFHLLEHGSQWILPQLHLEGVMNDLGLAFLDGCHLFEFAMLDFFYLEKALPIGGLLLVDDPEAPAVSTMLRFVESNRKIHVRSRTPFGCAILQKWGEDDRDWSHYLPFEASTDQHWGDGK